MFGVTSRFGQASRKALQMQARAFWEQAWARQSSQARSITTPARFRNRNAHCTPNLLTLPSRPLTSTSRVGNTFRAGRRTFRFSTKRANSQGGQGAEESLSFTARMRKLSQEYGWATVGVYLGLSILDFPFCFLLVRAFGTERIGDLEHYLVSSVSQVIPESVKKTWNDYRASFKTAEKEQLGNEEISEHVEMAGWGVEKAEQRNAEEASLGTQLALAYAIHKSFIFIRVPLTAAVTPRVVKVLRSWGWQIGKRKI